MAEVDVLGSIAWAKAIEKAGLIDAEELTLIVDGLENILHEIKSDHFEFQLSDEDVHTAVERRLTEKIGAKAGKLHTGRSRNDQVATDFRMWVRKAIKMTREGVREVQKGLVDRAEKDMGIIMPGYTHTQRAQPILLSHWWMSHYWALERDYQRLLEIDQRAAVLPLGSGALAGVPFDINRALLAKDLGFESVSENSLDATSDRDFAVEYLFTASLIAIHLSRLADAMILFTTAEFGFFELSDAYSTGSSLMPQKKNADTLELTRGKAGTLLGQLVGLMTVLKGLPSAYDKDLQEDKRPVFEAADTLELMLPVMKGVLITLQIHTEKISASLDPALLATDLADYLVRKGVPFREAHNLVGKCVHLAGEKRKRLDELTEEDYRYISPIFEDDVSSVYNFQQSVDRRSTTGGTGTESVNAQIKKARKLLTGF
jgi:argininosuccinate lyase